MRKTQVALAALALVASTAALADGVTVYGIIDASAVSANNTTSFAGTGNWLPSLFGVSGSEDLGGGLKATFNLEHGLSAGTGSIANGGIGTNQYNRAANVGLSGDFGAIKAGVQISPFIAGSLGGYVNDNMSYYVNSLALATASVASQGTGATATSGFFIPNAVSYSLPGNSPVSGSVLMAFDGDVAANEYSAATLGTTFGEVNVSGSFQTRGGAVGTGYKSFNFNANTMVAGAKVAAGYTKHDVDGSTEAIGATTIGVSYPIAANINVSVNLASASQTGAAKKNLSNASIQYVLSKRTFVYGTVGAGKNGAGVVYEGGPTYTTGSQTGTAIGLVHSF